MTKPPNKLTVSATQAWVSTKAPALENELSADVRRAVELTRMEPSNFNRRSLVRAAFAFVEGMTFALKQQCLVRHEENYCSFEPEELAVLRERTYALRENGEAGIRTMRIGMEENVKFTLRTVAKAFAPSVKIEFGGSEWASFSKAARIRDRITHPRDVEDLQISNDELRTVVNGLGWFQDRIDAILAAYQASVEKDEEMLRSAQERLRSAQKRLRAAQKKFSESGIKPKN